MAVSPGYLEKIRRAVRRSEDAEADAELCDLVEECRRDLISLGVREDQARDERDPLILGAARCFVRWKFGLSGVDAAANRDDYMCLRDELRKRVGYCTSPTGSS